MHVAVPIPITGKQLKRKRTVEFRQGQQIVIHVERDMGQSIEVVELDKVDVVHISGKNYVSFSKIQWTSESQVVVA
jgi:hypothetical protein